MLESYLRPSLQNILFDPISKILTKYFNLSPNLITLISCFTGILVIPFLIFDYKFLAAFVLIISGFLDVIDGSVARIKKESSIIGTIYDIISDRIVETSVILGLYLMTPNRGLPCLIMLSSILWCVTSFLVVGIFGTKNSKKSFHYSPGIIERAESFIFFIFMIFWSSAFNQLAYIYSFLVTLTTLLRVIEARNNFYKEELP